jgi:hypothetical protein
MPAREKQSSATLGVVGSFQNKHSTQNERARNRAASKAWGRSQQSINRKGKTKYGDSRSILGAQTIEELETPSSWCLEPEGRSSFDDPPHSEHRV